MQMKRASPEALALLMANKSKKDSKGGQKNWVPGGVAERKDSSSKRKLFY